MAVGLQIWNPSGVLVVDTSTRLGRIIGYTIVSANGSTTVDFSSGTGFAKVMPQFADAKPYLNATYAPTVSISGNTLSWTYPNQDNRPSSVIIYGVY